MVCIITIPWFYPAYKAGGPIQSVANMVEQFSDSIYYKIFCLNRDLDGTVLNVPVNKWVKYNGNTDVWYSSKASDTIRLLKKEMQDSYPDVLFVNGIYSWNFNLMPLLFCKVPRRIVSVRGMLHPGALSQKPFKKSIYLFLWKLAGLHKKCSFHASTFDERKFIKNVFGKDTHVFVAQNFPRNIKPITSYEKIAGNLKIVSIALISPMKNILLVLKALANCDDHVVYDIYGPVKDAGYWDTCLEQIKKLPENIHVKYYGDIPPAEVEITLSKSDVFILPSKSENFGHAIYEALISGKPVITSNNTPWNDLLESKAGANVSTDNLQELVNSIQFFAAMNENEFKEWRAGSYKYAAGAIDINDIKQQYKKMFLKPYSLYSEN